MAKTQGVQVYDILPNGCLNGTYANNGSSQQIFNEIARKKPYDVTGDIVGVYDCFYFDLTNVGYPCELEIKAGTTCQYEFIWRDGSGKKIFEGQGWKNTRDQIMLKYQSV